MCPPPGRARVNAEPPPPPRCDRRQRGGAKRTGQQGHATVEGPATAATDATWTEASSPSWCGMRRASARRLRSCLPGFRSSKRTSSRYKRASSPRRCHGYTAFNPQSSRGTRGRRDGGPAKGGNVAIYERDGRHFTVLSGPFKPAADDTAEVCGVRLLGTPDVDLINIDRPPIRPDEADESGQLRPRPHTRRRQRHRHRRHQRPPPAVGHGLRES